MRLAKAGKEGRVNARVVVNPEYVIKKQIVTSYFSLY